MKSRKTRGEDVEIVLHGISMGGATALMASGMELPEHVKGIISDCGFTSPKEVLVRDSEGVIEAEIFPDYEYASKKKIKDLTNTLQEFIDEYNKKAPMYKRVGRLKIRETEFEKNTTKKIKRF